MAERVFSWSVAPDHPVFAGHFPGHPIVPGVMLLDHAISLAGSMLIPKPGAWQVGNAKFLSPVVPGESLDFKLVERDTGSIAFTVFVGERGVASGLLTPVRS
jgi:3-hydroxymyristoyl/3-hydroxydecanoyl-(acyl carrier protein) dehydratase